MRASGPMRPSRRMWIGALLVAATGATLAQHQNHQSARKAASLAVAAAVAPDGALWIAGLDETGRLFVQTSADGSEQFGPRRLLDLQGDTVQAEGEFRPSLIFGPQGRVVLAYTRPRAKRHTGEVRLLRSSDGGATFGTPVTVHTDRQVLGHELQALGFDGQGHLHVAWIDRRDSEASRHKTGRGDAYRGAGVYHTVSTDGGATFRPETKLADHSCECCRIAVTPTGDGRVALMWRHVYEDNQRDHAFALLGGAAPAAVTRATSDRWAIEACPHHGPGLAAARDGGYHAVWFGQRDGQVAVRYGRLDAAGKPAGAVQVIPDERAEHAVVGSTGSHVALVWRSFDGQATRLRAQVSGDEGRTFRTVDLATSAEATDHPMLVVRNGQFKAVWRTASKLHVVSLAP
jgi:hypothetical protein